MNFRSALMLAAGLAIAGCAESAQQPVSSAMGPAPTLEQPRTSLFPSVKIAQAQGWPAGQAPTAAQGLSVKAFAAGLDHPRWLHVLPNGDVLVAETNAPPRPDDSAGIIGYFQTEAMKKAGAVTQTANRITRLRDQDVEGVA